MRFLHIGVVGMPLVKINQWDYIIVYRTNTNFREASKLYLPTV